MNRLRFGCVILALLVGLALPAWADEQILTGTLQNTASTGNGDPLEVEHFTSAILQVTISATATVNFEGSADGVTYAAIRCSALGVAAVPASSTTVSGIFQCPSAAGLHSIRTPVAANSGTVVVFGRSTTAPIIQQVIENSMIHLLGCEHVDQVEDLGYCRVVGGVVRTTTIMVDVTTNTTSATVRGSAGPMVISANIDGTGAQVVDVNVYGDITSTAEPINLLCTIALSATTRDVDACPPFEAPYPYLHAVTTNISGTGAAVDVQYHH